MRYLTNSASASPTTNTASGLRTVLCLCGEASRERRVLLPPPRPSWLNYWVLTCGKLRTAHSGWGCVELDS